MKSASYDFIKVEYLGILDILGNLGIYQCCERRKRNEERFSDKKDQPR